MKKSQVLILILCLISVEHLLYPVAISVRESIVHEKEFIAYLTEKMLSRSELSAMMIIFTIRLLLWTPLLFLIFSQIIYRQIGIGNIFFLAILNVGSNVLIIGLYSVTLFPGLITVPATQYTLVITIISPFILNFLPLSRQYVQAFMTAASAIGGSSP